MRHLLVPGTLAALLLAPLPALAADNTCTDAQLDAKREELMKFMQANPGKEKQVIAIVADIENNYGGEPPRDQQCQAMDEVITQAKALK